MSFLLRVLTLLSLIGQAMQVDLKLTWSKHCRVVVSKGTKSLDNLIHRSMFNCTREVKYAVYKAIIRPTIEYAAVVWNPHNLGDGHYS